MITFRTVLLLILLYIGLFSFQQHFFPYILMPPVPADAGIALAPPQLPLLPHVTSVPEEPEVPRPEATPPLVFVPPKPQPLTLRALLLNGTRNIIHYRYAVYSTEYPYVIDVSANTTLIRYQRNRFFVPNLMIDRVFLNHSSKTATATCIIDWLCMKVGSYYETIPVSYDLFNIPTVYDILGPYIDLAVVEQAPFEYVERRSVSRARLANGYTVLYIRAYQFPIQIIDDQNRTIFSSTAAAINDQANLHLFSYTVNAAVSAAQNQNN